MPAKQRDVSGFNRLTPYVGITGFTKPGEAKEVFSVLPQNPDHFYMIGVLMSSKTLNGENNRFRLRYPRRESVRDAFGDFSDMVMNTIHYSTDTPENLLLETAAILGLCGGYVKTIDAQVKAIQLNVPWPKPSLLEQCYKTVFAPAHLMTILQVGKSAILQANRSPTAIAERLREYTPLIHYALIDASGGTGTPLDIEFVTACVRAISDLDLPINVGIAGGLSPSTIDTIAPLLREFPNLSIDAEGSLRNSDDELEILLAKEYLHKAGQICQIKEDD
jgi:hypothetical protein